MKRRDFLHLAGAAGLGCLGGVMPLGALAQQQDPAPGKRLVVLFLRGGLDGLSALPPLEDPVYCSMRPSIAIPAPGREGGALPLTTSFGLHPALEPLLAPWRAGTLAMIPSCGLPEPLRVHAEAQRVMETGNPKDRHARDGWMARLLGFLGPGAKALALTPTPPLALQGRPNVQHIRPGGYPPSVWPLERPPVFAGFDAVYAGNANDAMIRAYRQTQIALKNRFTEMDREISVSAAGAPSIKALPDLAVKIAGYLKQNQAARMVFATLGGFDAHYGQGTATGRLADALTPLGKGLAVLGEALGDSLKDTAVLVMSEFGRSLRENAYAGTENGHGTLFMLLGGGVAGGVLHGPWPGLATDKLSDGQDLAAAVDFREVIAALTTQFFRLGPETLTQVTPGFTPAGTLAGLFPG